MIHSIRNSAYFLTGLAFALASCGGDESSPPPISQQAPEQPTPSPTPTPTSTSSAYVPLFSQTSGSDLGFVCSFGDTDRPFVLDAPRRGGVISFDVSTSSYSVAFSDIARRFDESNLDADSSENRRHYRKTSADGRQEFELYFTFSGDLFADGTNREAGTLANTEMFSYWETLIGGGEEGGDLTTRHLACAYGMEKGPPTRSGGAEVIFPLNTTDAFRTDLNERRATGVGQNTAEWSAIYDPEANQIKISAFLGSSQPVGGTGSTYNPWFTRTFGEISVTGSAKVDPTTGRFQGSLNAFDGGLDSRKIELELGGFSGTFFGDDAKEMALSFVIVEKAATAGNQAFRRRGIIVAQQGDAKAN